MNKKNLKILSVLFFITTLSFGSYKLVYWAGETYFFDKLFYRKSSSHGYLKSKSGDYFADYSLQNKLIKDRSSDLYELMYGQSKVLGASTTDNIFSIAIIGDSMAYGLGVKKDQALVSILEKKLNKIKPTRVYNYNQPGDDIINNYAKYKTARENQNIDLFIITLVDNDLIFNDIDRYPQNRNVYLEILTECEKEPEFFKYDNIKSWNEWMHKLYYPSFSEEYSNICFLERIVSRFDMSNTFFFSFGHIQTQAEANQQLTNDASSKYLKIFSKYGEVIVNNDGYILDPFKEEGINYTVISELEGHPSKEVHEQYAQKIFEEIINNSKWDFSKN